MAASFEERAAAQMAPPGFSPIVGLDGLISDTGPIFAKREDDGSVVFGCRVMPNMCNPMGMAHGGWVATLCDVSLPLTARLTVPEYAERFLLTINISVDYLMGAKLGEWLESRCRILKRTKRMVFVDGLLSVDGELTARTNGVFRIGPAGAPIEL